MKFVVQLIVDEEGVAVSVPALPGCHSQGDTREEALANIEDAIRLYLDTDVDFATASFETSTIDVDVDRPYAEAAGH